MSHTHDEMPGDRPPCPHGFPTKVGCPLCAGLTSAAPLKPNGPKPPSSQEHRDLAARHLVVVQERNALQQSRAEERQRVEELEVQRDLYAEQRDRFLAERDAAVRDFNAARAALDKSVLEQEQERARVQAHTLTWAAGMAKTSADDNYEVGRRVASTDPDGGEENRIVGDTWTRVSAWLLELAESTREYQRRYGAKP